MVLGHGWTEEGEGAWQRRGVAVVGGERRGAMTLGVLKR